MHAGHDEQAIVMELEKVERRNAELVSRNTSVEAELANFKTYMRDAGGWCARSLYRLDMALHRAVRFSRSEQLFAVTSSLVHTFAKARGTYQM